MKIVLAATILVSSMTLAHAQGFMPRPYGPSPYYSSYAYPPFPYAPYYPHRDYSQRVRVARDAPTKPTAVSNPGIVSVQRKLQALGFLPWAVSADGIAGPQTKTAIANWQKSIDRPMTGLLTPAEVQALYASNPSSKAIANPTVALPNTSSLGQDAVMSALKELTQ